MNRRNFFKLSSTALILPFLSKCGTSQNSQFPIEVNSARGIGHQIFSQLPNIPVGATIKTDYLVVGAGIAGLAAASKLKNKDFYLLELDKEIGGSSSAGSFNNVKFAQGAHYELSYPSNYGQGVLTFLNELDVIYHDGLTNTWKFKDKQYLIDKSSESICRSDGIIRGEVLPKGTSTNLFFKILQDYEGKMVMPTRLITNDLKALNNITFYDFLKSKIDLTKELVSAINYQLRDDFGAGSNIVSALAGIHYYMCRPYHKKEMELFSPPQGNFYFADKMLRTLPVERVKTSHLVYQITEEKRGYKVGVIDVAKRVRKEFLCNRIVYAGQKHSLKHVFPKYYSLFQNNTYAPWVVVNLVVKNFYSEEYYWQNEILSKEENPFMGFVDSKSQATINTDYRVLTSYFCYPFQSRELLVEIEKNPRTIVNEVARLISDFLQEDIQGKIEKAFVKVLGHAMPIPKINYLFPNQLPRLDKNGIAFAGVDTGRLPLLFEALDSGLGSNVSLI